MVLTLTDFVCTDLPGTGSHPHLNRWGVPAKLNSLIQKYNYQWIHSTTGEIPYIRFQRALKENKSLFREFAVRPPYKSIKDIFCLRANRMVNSYRKVSINNLELRVPSAPLREKIQLGSYQLLPITIISSI